MGEMLVSNAEVQVVRGDREPFLSEQVIEVGEGEESKSFADGQRQLVET